MNLKCLSSGSQGNCYILTSNNGEKLILDCGISIKEIKKGLDWNIKAVAGVIVSHVHSDHSKSLNDLRKMGIKVFAPYESGEVKKAHCVMGSFDISAFDLPHNGCWNNGFYIKCDGQKMLYMTDYEYCSYNFQKLKINHMLIECNYIKDMVDVNIPNYEHKIRGHAELETVKKFVELNNTDDLQNVILCHLGQETTEPEECVAEIQKIVPGANVDYARAGLEIELRKKGECPF